MPRNFLFLLFLPLVGSPCLALDPQPDLYFIQIGAGTFGNEAFRTVFRLSNEGQDTVTGHIQLFDAEGAPLSVEFDEQWTGPGNLEKKPGLLEFTIPTAVTLHLTMIVPVTPTTGWARISRDGLLTVQTLLQYAEDLSGASPPENFEDHVVRQVETHGVEASKSFFFPVSLYEGFQTLNTAFAVVNLSGVAASARLLLRPDNEKTVVLQPGEISAHFFDEFWSFAVPAIFPLRLSQVVRVQSDAPLGIAAFNTIQGRALFGLAPLSRSGESGVLLETELGEEFQLRIDETASLPGVTLEVQFWNVAEDSRCPTDVTCVWEGQARIALRVRRGESEFKDVELVSRAGNSQLAQQGYEGFLLELLGVEPQPISSTEIQLDDYIITLRVSEAEE